MAGCYEPPRTGAGGTIDFFVSEHANLDGLKAAIESMVLRFGTIECGIGGYELRMLTEREGRAAGPHEEVAPGVKAVTHKR